ncbi:hypothetical protein [Rossellomorea marisflavi]|uniref:hypothetical protein n=1 Tax=Rossellomorea marisflavi TaxID=189381 RepID=UPI0009A6CF4F|nr:hypothetical protein [Rossellomorea marisflavi]
MAFRTITRTYKVSSLEGLRGPNRQAALSAVARQREEEFNEFHSEELLNTLQAIALKFGALLKTWSFGLFSRSHVVVDTETMSEQVREQAVMWLNEHITYRRGELPEGCECPFTGVYYDEYFFDMLTQEEVLTVDNVGSIIARGIAFTLNRAITTEEESIISQEENERYALDMGLEFLEDGSIYHGEDDNEEDED